MELHRYQSYDEYKAAQIKGNMDKLHESWVRREIVNMVCDRVIVSVPRPTFGLCHGTRRGEEQKLFSTRLMCQVIGTEISPTAAHFPNTIEWDFHEAKEEWIGVCDFIYSNSLDHAMYPERALATWLACLSSDGVLAIEWIEKLGKGRVKRATETDPFAATVSELCSMIESAGGEIMEVAAIKIPNHDRKSFLVFAGRPT